MVRGFYAAASGMLSGQRTFDVISNNISNSTTTGFKGQNTLESTFGQYYLSRINSLGTTQDQIIGSSNFITVNQEEFTDLTQGSLEATGRDLDFAIDGEGFFLIDSETYGEVVTRNGQFTLDKDGYLVIEGLGKVLNDARDPIQISGSDIAVNNYGVIFEDGEESDSFFIGVPQEGADVKAVGSGVYRFANGEAEMAALGSYQIMQTYIEKSNIKVASEMSKAMVTQNHFNSCVQVLKIYDKINEISVNQIGRVG